MRTPAKLLLLLVLALAGCADGAAPPAGRLPVVAAFYPLEFITSRVGGDVVTVTDLAKPGAEPHDLELSVAQVRDVADARLVVYLRGFQPAVDETVDQQARDSAFDVSTVEPLRAAAPGDEDAGAHDPHVWLDPIRLAAIADRLAERLSTVDPSHAADYRARASVLRTDLEQLDREYAAGLATCQRRDIVTSHAAFGYLTDRYHLRQIAITGLSPEEEPSPGHLAAAAQQARAAGATTIFFEPLVSPKLAETLAAEVHAKAEVLDPIEGLAPGATGDYFTVMRANLQRLQEALGCA